MTWIPLNALETFDLDVDKVAVQDTDASTYLRKASRD